jgi:putative acetyltransferase
MITLREAREDDRAALIALWVAAWRDVFPLIDFPARAPWFAGHLDGCLAKGATLTLAEDAQGLAGFALFDAASGEMDQLCVAPRAQGAGAARALMAALKQASPRIALAVNRDNPRALRFYEREGFRVTGESVNPRSGLPVLAMEWTREAAR